jgi:hypothetical protein
VLFCPFVQHFFRSRLPNARLYFPGQPRSLYPAVGYRPSPPDLTPASATQPSYGWLPLWAFVSPSPEHLAATTVIRHFLRDLNASSVLLLRPASYHSNNDDLTTYLSVLPRPLPVFLRSPDSTSTNIAPALQEIYTLGARSRPICRPFKHTNTGAQRPKSVIIPH